MAFNSSFAGNSGMENFYNNSIDFNKLYGASAVQDSLEALNAIKRKSSTFNNVLGADAKSIMEKYRMEGQQNLHDAQMFSQNLGTAAGFLSSGISAFGNLGNSYSGTGSTGGLGETFKMGDTSKYGDVVQNPMDSFAALGYSPSQIGMYRN